MIRYLACPRRTVTAVLPACLPCSIAGPMLFVITSRAAVFLTFFHLPDVYRPHATRVRREYVAGVEQPPVCAVTTPPTLPWFYLHFVRVAFIFVLFVDYPFPRHSTLPLFPVDDRRIPPHRCARTPLPHTCRAPAVLPSTATPCRPTPAITYSLPPGPPPATIPAHCLPSCVQRSDGRDGNGLLNTMPDGDAMGGRISAPPYTRTMV